MTTGKLEQIRAFFMSKLRIKFHVLCKESLSIQVRTTGDYLQILEDFLHTIGYENPINLSENKAIFILNHLVKSNDVSIDRLIEAYGLIPTHKTRKIVQAEGIKNHMILARARLRTNGVDMKAADAASEIINDYINRKEIRAFTDKNFYRTREWRELRLAVLEVNRKCRLCGRTPMDGIKLHIDHIKPRSLYPELSLSIHNLQVLCDECNTSKSNLVAI